MSTNMKDELYGSHPGLVLARELAELGMSAADFDAAIAVPAGVTAKLLEQRGKITPELALRLSHYFGCTARFWTDLQNAYDLDVAEQRYGAAIAAEIMPRVTPDDIPVWAGGNKVD